MNTSRFVLKPQYNTDQLGLQKEYDNADNKISDTNGLVKNRL